MSSVVRRAGSKLLKFIARAADPGGTAGQVKTYAKDVSGTAQYFAQVGDGTVYQLTPNSAIGRVILPECWQLQDAAAAIAATAMAAGVSQLFDDYQAIRDGSIIGINLRGNAVLAAGTITGIVTINGVATALTVVIAAPNSSGRNTAAPLAIPYVAGDLIGVQYTTSAGFLPSGSIDFEASVEVDET